MAGWRWFDLSAIRYLVLQVLVADFLKFQLADDADVAALGAEGFDLGEFGGADLVAHDEHLHGGGDAAVEFGTEALDGGGHLVAFHVDLLEGAGKDGNLSVERIGGVGTVCLLREVAAVDLAVTLNLRRWRGGSDGRTVGRRGCGGHVAHKVDLRLRIFVEFLAVEGDGLEEVGGRVDFPTLPCVDDDVECGLHSGFVLLNYYRIAL